MKLYCLKNDNLEQVSSDDVVFDYSCDVLCVGAGCAGIYASFAAARENTDVILLENDANIGGMHVCGNVDGYYYGFEGGSFLEDDEKCKSENAFFGNKQYPEAKQVFFAERLIDSGVNLKCKHTPVGIYFEGAKAVGLKVFDGDKHINIKSKIIIDATSDGHLIRMCPVNKYYGRPIDGKTVPFTVRTQFISNGKYISNNADSGYVNQYDSREFSKKVILAHANSTKYLKDNEFLSLASHAGVREGLSFEGEEVLRYTDIICDKQPQKVLFYAYSDLDKHGHDYALDDELFQNWWVISNLATVTANIPVPLGSVVPNGLKGIVTAGRCLSCDSYSQSAVRMNRDMFRMGECVGIAAAMAAKSDVEFMEINYNEYVQKAKGFNCYDSGENKKFGFDFPNKMKPYIPVEFDVDKNIHLLETETPGVAIWSCFVNKNRDETIKKVYNKMCDASDELVKYNCAIALGIMEDKRAVPVLKEIIEKRDCFYFKDCRRSNQFRTAIAICLIGRLGDMDDIQLLEEIVFDESEFENEIYHTLEPNVLYYNNIDRNFVYFDFFTHACMSIVKIYKRNDADIKSLHIKLKELFDDGKIIRRITDTKADEPTHIEIADFQKYILKVTE